MTTVIGIAGKDPDTLEDYVILCADSRGTLYGRTPLDIKKVFAGENSNYAFAIAGRSIDNNFSKEFDSEIYNFINNPKIENEQYVEQMLKSVDDALLKQYGEKNNILASIKKEHPELLKLSKGGLVNVGAYKSVGSGSEYIFSLYSLENYVVNGRVNLSKSNVLNVVLDAMNEAASKDEFTGGHMDVAIISSLGNKFLPAYRNIEKSSKISAPLLNEGDAPQNIMIHPYQRDD